MISVLVYSVKNYRKGSMPLRTVAKITLAVLAVALIFAGASGWISTMGEKFVAGIQFPG